MPVALIALAAAASYGIGDYCGTVGAGRIGVAPATLVCYLVATIALGLTLPFGATVWSTAAVSWGAVAAVCTLGGLLSFYAAALDGSVSLVSPLIGVMETSVPVAVAMTEGERFRLWTWIGITVACTGAVFVSIQRSGASLRLTRRSALLATCAGITLGFSIVAFDRAPAQSGLAPAFVECAGGLIVLASVLALGRLHAGLTKHLASRDGRTSTLREHYGKSANTHAVCIRMVGPAALAGLSLGVGNALLVIGLRHGTLAVVGVLVDLYPAFAVVAAWAFAHERLTRIQSLGVCLAVAASALLALN